MILQPGSNSSSINSAHSDTSIPVSSNTTSSSVIGHPTTTASEQQGLPDAAAAIVFVHFSLVSMIFGGSSNATKCYGPLGCLEINEKWYGLTRPVNLLPQPREEINTQFILRTRKTIKKPTFLNVTIPQTISRSDFDGNKPTIFLVHGFIDTGFVPWVEELSTKLLRNEDVNVVAVDWGGGSASMYSQSAANTRLVALEISHLMHHLTLNHGSTVEDFHIIGHSLGSHIAGYAGEDMQKKTGGRKIGRISGLDPAEPLFEAMPPFVRLDPGDAHFVDVIHTDAKTLVVVGYGLLQPVGHVDFYPNGGTGQPGCSIMDTPVSFDNMVDADKAVQTVGRHMVACSHCRAVELYIESLDFLLDQENACPMVGFECRSYDEFTKGKCLECGEDGSRCARVGHSAINYKKTIEQRGEKNIKFYFNTGAHKPFCQYHYVLSLNLANPKSAETWVQGNLKVNLHGSRAEVLNHDLTPDNPLDTKLGVGKDMAFDYWIESPVKLGDLESLELEWSGSIGSYCEPNSRWWWWIKKMCYSNEFYVRTISLYQQRESRVTASESSVTVCGDNHGVGYSIVKSGEWKMFYKSCPTTQPASSTTTTTTTTIFNY